MEVSCRFSRLTIHVSSICILGIDAATLSFTLVCREQNIVSELPRPAGTFRLLNEVSCGLSRLTVLVLSILYSWYRRFHAVCFTNVSLPEYRERNTSPNCHIPPPNVGFLSSVSGRLPLWVCFVSFRVTLGIRQIDADLTQLGCYTIAKDTLHF
jgi:hypothetical protein